MTAATHPAEMPNTSFTNGSERHDGMRQKAQKTFGSARDWECALGVMTVLSALALMLILLVCVHPAGHF